MPRLGTRLPEKQTAPGSRRSSAAGPASDWQSVASFVTRVTGPVISLQPAETQRDTVKAVHLGRAGASHISLMNNGHFAHRQALI